MTRDTLASRFARELDALALAPGTWIVAVSGGPDSVALLLLLASEAAGRGLALVVAHADHGIHPDSAAVAARVCALGERFGLPVAVGRLGLAVGATETEARAARWTWLRAQCAAHAAEGILTAHHADDQAETVLMRVLRGSGPAGLAGMARRAGDVVRPLLPFRREELARHVLEQRETAWLDPANADPIHLRSWIRASLLPRVAERLPDVTERLLSVAAQARQEREAWDAVLERLPGLSPRETHDGVSLDAAAIAALEAPLAAQLLRVAARRVGRTLPHAAARRARRLAQQGESGQRVDLGQGWTAELAFGRLVIAPAAALVSDAKLPDAGTLRWGGWSISVAPERAGRPERGGWRAWAPAGELSVGPPRTGERLRPLGGSGSRAIARLLQEARVPRGERVAWPVLRSSGRPFWVPGVSRSDASVPEPGQEAIRIDVQRA